MKCDDWKDVEKRLIFPCHQFTSKYAGARILSLFSRSEYCMKSRKRSILNSTRIWELSSLIWFVEITDAFWLIYLLFNSNLASSLHAAVDFKRCSQAIPRCSARYTHRRYLPQKFPFSKRWTPQQTRSRSEVNSLDFVYYSCVEICSGISCLHRCHQNLMFFAAFQISWFDCRNLILFNWVCYAEWVKSFYWILWWWQGVRMSVATLNRRLIQWESP